MANIGSGDDWSPLRQQAITWTSTDLLSIRFIVMGVSKNVNPNTSIFIQQFESVKVVC